MGLIITLKMTPEHKQAKEASYINQLWEPKPTRKQSLHSDSVQIRICKLYEFGYTLHDLSDWFELKPKEVGFILSKHGIQRKDTSPNKYKHVKESPQNYQYEHRQIVERLLGRKLNSDELVHHINGDINDNTIENLLVVTYQQHKLLHSK